MPRTRKSETYEYQKIKLNEILKQNKKPTKEDIMQIKSHLDKGYSASMRHAQFIINGIVPSKDDQGLNDEKVISSWV